MDPLRTLGLDRYDRTARLGPGLLTVLPSLFFLVAVFRGGLATLGAAVSLVMWAGGAVLVTNLARDAGRAREAALFESFGGEPTVALLRHRGTLDHVSLVRYHAKLQAIVPGIRMPTASEEAADPAAADETYRSCCAFLREKTRGDELLFRENCTYGFRRNLWGLRSWGLIIGALSVVGILGATWLQLAAGQTMTGFLLVAGAGSVVMLFLWLLVFNRDWVRVSADAYARALLAACDTL